MQLTATQTPNVKDAKHGPYPRIILITLRVFTTLSGILFWNFCQISDVSITYYGKQNRKYSINLFVLKLWGVPFNSSFYFSGYGMISNYFYFLALTAYSEYYFYIQKS